MSYAPKDIHPEWANLLQSEFTKSYFKDLRYKLAQEYINHTIFPTKENIFTAFNLTPIQQTNVVIIGQDPYHGEGEAHGLCFSVQKGITIPPSLVNIFKELKTDLGIAPSNHGDLTSWAKQGVLLLNSVLTVKKSQPNSHQNIGWETFTNQTIALLSSHKQSLVFVLWGKNAQRKKILIDPVKHYILESPHPSPLSAHRGFFNSQPFSKINAFLRKQNKSEIDWHLNSV